MPFVRKGLSLQGISIEAQNIICESWRAGTNQQYNTYLKRWQVFCSGRGIDPLLVYVKDILDFLVELYNTGLKYSAIGTARSALSNCVKLVDSTCVVGEHPLVSRFLKGVFELRPSLPRYKQIWDVKIVLNYLEKLSPNEDLSLLDLSTKLVTLLAIVSGQRCQSLHVIKTCDMIFETNRILIPINSIIKQSKPNKTQPVMVLPVFYNQNLCVVRTMKEYLNRTEIFRCEKENRELFLTTVKPYLPASKSTISRWIKTALSKAGIDVNIYSAHRTRAASTSAAARILPLTSIMKAAGWTNSRTFQRFYNVPNNDDNEANDFATTVLNLNS
ncbi:hypothetical protein SNE40_020817 [Patella caerulea]|uniref:Tyr recombinase domain-containing protein n=2 Tax=Patella caerulea TaxID=87958 RepID=A0AAN8J5J4_PATCE